jgi:hypothetical protein
MDRIVWSEKSSTRNNEYYQKGMLCTNIDTYRSFNMSRNVAFDSIKSMLEYAYENAALKPGSWVIVAQAFVQDDAVGVEGFLAVERDEVLYTPYSPGGYDYDVVKACKENRERPEKVIQHQLPIKYETRLGMFKTANSGKGKVVETLLQSVFCRVNHS